MAQDIISTVAIMERGFPCYFFEIFYQENLYLLKYLFARDFFRAARKGPDDELLFYIESAKTKKTEGIGFIYDSEYARSPIWHFHETKIPQFRYSTEPIGLFFASDFKDEYALDLDGFDVSKIMDTVLAGHATQLQLMRMMAQSFENFKRKIESIGGHVSGGVSSHESQFLIPVGENRYIVRQ